MTLLIVNDLDLPQADLDFRFGNGSPSMDLVATIGERWRRCFERLRSTEDLQSWIHRAGLSPSLIEVRPEDLDAARDLRGASYSLVVHRMSGNPPAPEPSDSLNRLARVAEPVVALGDDWTATAPVPTVEQVLGALARDAIEVLTTVPTERLRECASDTCSRLFIDRSRPGSRRWCSSTACGNKTRTRAYRRRSMDDDRP